MKLLCRCGRKEDARGVSLFYERDDGCGLQLNVKSKQLSSNIYNLTDEELYAYVSSQLEIMSEKEFLKLGVFERINVKAHEKVFKDVKAMLNQNMGVRLRLGQQKEFPRIVLFGSRDIKGYERSFTNLIDILTDAMTEQSRSKTSFIGGCASGADTVGINYIKDKYFYEEFPADWKNIEGLTNVRHNEYGAYNPKAGFERNSRMAQTCNCALGIWDGKSSGTLHMKNKLERMEKPFLILNLQGEPVFKNRVEDFNIWLKEEERF